jgi:16S rRNA (uracil1498-N3)-methyltransferase
LHLFYLSDISTGHLPAAESQHAVKVLRLTTGEEVNVTDGRGTLYKAVITDANPKQCNFRVIEKTIIPEKPFSIHLAVAPTKNADRMEWMVEKCVEIGIDTISFVLCKKSERKSINLDRMEKLAVSAMKQSQQYWLPTLNDIVPLDQFIAKSKGSKFIAFVDESNPNHLKEMAKPGDQYTVLIGPEGDFSTDELSAALQSGFQKVSLGPNRLRTETAGLAAVMILNMVNVASA